MGNSQVGSWNTKGQWVWHCSLMADQWSWVLVMMVKAMIVTLWTRDIDELVVALEICRLHAKFHHHSYQNHHSALDMILQRTPLVPRPQNLPATRETASVTLPKQTMMQQWAEFQETREVCH